VSDRRTDFADPLRHSTYITGTGRETVPKINAKRRIEMTTTTSWMRRVAAGAVLAAAALVATAGAAQAAPSPDYRSNGPITIRYNEGPFGLGVNASIWDDNNPDGVVEVCHYSSIGVNGTAPIPFSGTAVLNGRGPGTVHIPGGPTGGQWNVSVHCDGSGQSMNFTETY
jgi:hypothetical protein